MSQSVVNTNISSVTDPNGSRGEIPSSVMAYDMGAASGTAGNPQAFALVAGTETVGAYQGTIVAGAASAGAGITQVITLTFANDFVWQKNENYCDVSFVSTAADPQTATASAGTGNATFDPTDPRNSIVIKRTAGKLNAGSVNLTAAHMVVRVRTRGVAVTA